jgi:integrase
MRKTEKAKMLTEQKIKNLKFISDGEKAKRFADKKESNLLIQVGRSSKTFYFRFRQPDTRKNDMMKIGSYPLVSLKEARDKAFQLRKILEEGKNPKIETLVGTHKGKLFAEVLQEARALNLPDTKVPEFQKISQVEAKWNRAQKFIKHFSNSAIRKITADQIAAVLNSDAVKKPSNYLEREINNVLNEVFKLARKKMYISTNPMLEIVNAEAKEGDSNNRIRYNFDYQIFHEHLQLTEWASHNFCLNPKQGRKDNWNVGEPIQAGYLWKLCELFVVRPDSLLCAKWSHFDLEKKLWTVTSVHMKGKREKDPDFVLPISRQALEVIERAMAKRVNDWVLPRLNKGKTEDKPGTRSIFTNSSHRLLKRHYTPHGYRHMFSTYMREMDYDDNHVEKTLAHSTGNESKKAYDHSKQNRLKGFMLQRWADFLDDFRTADPTELEAVIEKHTAQIYATKSENVVPFPATNVA